MAYCLPSKGSIPAKDVMDTILIRYFEQAKDTKTGAVTQKLLGKEALGSISEALLPGISKHHVYCTKKFTGVTNYRWHVEQVSLASFLCTSPVIYDVVLSKLFSTSAPEEYLRQTLDKTGQKIDRLATPGTLVDVDYGFIQVVAREDGQMKTNKRYCDTLQKGEMHKRRLAVVVRAKRGVVQVAPVTSQDSPGDKTCFKLSAATLSQLSQWGSSGKDSWVLAGMIETVSSNRILPPQTFRKGRTGRNPNYTTRLTNQELNELKLCIAHNAGISDYSQVKTKLLEAQQGLATIPALTQDIAALQAERDALLQEVQELRLVKEVAEDWSKEMGSENVLAERVADLRGLYEMMEAEQA